MFSKKEFLRLTAIFIIWRVLLFVVAYSAPYFLSYQPSFPYAQQLSEYGLPQWLFSWANFDGVHYLTIITKGYFGTGLIQAFFPLFPLLITIFTGISDPLVIGLIASTLFSYLLILTFYTFVKRFTPKHHFLTLLVLLVFPTSFFFGAFYTESLFLILVLQTFIQADKKNWLLAGIFAGLASATRIIGILLVPALLIEYFFEKKTFFQALSLLKNKKTRTVFWCHIKEKVSLKLLKNIFFISIGATGLLLYMTYLYIRFGDPLYFFHVQSEFGGGRQESLVLYPQVVFRYIKILLTARPFDLKYFAYTQEFIAGVIGLLLLVFAHKKVRLSHLLFALGAFFIPTITGTFSSMPRYILVCWPLFIVIAQLLTTNKYLKYGYLLVSLILLIINTILFIQGYWVA